MAKFITGETAEKMRAAFVVAIEAIDAQAGYALARVRLDNGGSVYFVVDGVEYRAGADSLAFYGRFLVYRVSDGEFVGYLRFEY